MVWCRKAILHVPVFPSRLRHNSHLRTIYSDGWKGTFLSQTGWCRGFTLLFTFNQVTFSIRCGSARCILDLFRVYPPPPWGLASPRLMSPSCPYQSLISHFQDSHQAFLATVVVLEINPGRTSPCFFCPPLVTGARVQILAFVFCWNREEYAKLSVKRVNHHLAMTLRMCWYWPNSGSNINITLYTLNLWRSEPHFSCTSPF